MCVLDAASRLYSTEGPCDRLQPTIHTSATVTNVTAIARPERRLASRWSSTSLRGQARVRRIGLPSVTTVSEPLTEHSHAWVSRHSERATESPRHPRAMLGAANLTAGLMPLPHLRLKPDGRRGVRPGNRFAVGVHLPG